MKTGSYQGRAVPQAVSMPLELRDALFERAKEEGRPFSWMCRDALVTYLERGDNEPAMTKNGQTKEPTTAE